MRITTWNVNGLRAALRKGFADHLDAIAPDVLLLQEVRALPEQLPKAWQDPEGWHVLWNPAQKKGYAGTAVWSRQPIETHLVGLNKKDKDEEGRLITAEVGGVGLASVYLPSGSSGDHRQAEKEKWMKAFKPWAEKQREAGKPFIFGGDLNIAHTPRDIFPTNVIGSVRLSTRAGRTWSVTTMTGCSSRAGISWEGSVSRARASSPTSMARIPGGPTVAAPAPRTAAGGSITCWRTRQRPSVFSRPISIAKRG